MRLLCVVPSYLPAFQFGGPIFSVHQLNKALIKKGVDVTVYTTNVGLENRVSTNSEVDIEGVKAVYFTFTRFFEFMGETGWQFSRPMTNSLKENLRKFDIVYIVSVWNYPVVAAANICRVYKKPYIISPRGMLYPYLLRKKAWKKLPYYHLVIKKALQEAQAIHYTSDDEARKCHLRAGLNNRFFVIPNGVDISEFENLPDKKELKRRYLIPEDKRVLLFLGRINWKKGLDILLKAYSELSKQRGDIHLIIAGNDQGGYLQKVKGWARGYGIPYKDYTIGQDNSVSNPRITFTGMLTGGNKLEAFAGSDIFVLPSYSENFGMSVVEAMASGLAVIITDQVGIYREVDKAGAGSFVEANADQLRDAIGRLLDNPLLCKKMGDNGRRLVKEEFNWDNIADKMINNLEGIISRQ